MRWLRFLSVPLLAEDAGGGSVTADPADESSLADHEQTYGERRPSQPASAPAAAAEAAPAAEPVAADDSERDEKGQFKPKHRAKSQQAGLDDVPRIRELTRRLRETEAQLEETRRSRPAPAPAAADTPAPAPERFPKFETWLEKPENKDKDFYDYQDARDEWSYTTRRTAERAEEARAHAEQKFRDELSAYQKQLPAVQKQYPDFEDVVAAAPPVSKVIERAMLLVGPAAAYYLATHDEEREALSADTLVHPDNPAFAATVAATKRYLSTLVASEQRSSSPSRAAAVPSGSALALVSPNTPKPPNPGRTGALRDSDALPGDEASLAEHEKAFGQKRQRA